MGAEQGLQPVQHSANIGHFSTQQLLDAAAHGNPYVAAEMQKRGLNPDGTPIKPEWQGLADESGLLKEQFQLKPEIDTSGLDAYKARALGTGPSEMANRLMGAQALEEQRQREQFGQQAGSAAAQARSGLASKGGLSSGAAERLAQAQLRNQMMGNQNIGMQGAQQRANIGIQDEGQRTQMLQNLPGMQLQFAQPGIDAQKFNIQAGLNENLQKRAFDTNQFNQKMQAWAGGQQSEAIKSSDGGKK